VPIVLISGSLSLLEPSRPVKACNGITFYLNKYPLKWIELLLVLGILADTAVAVVVVVTYFA
jgi:hypothetical protein